MAKVVVSRRAGFYISRMRKLLPLLPIAVLSILFAGCASPSKPAPAEPPNTAIIPESRGTNWITRHEGFVEQARHDQIPLLFIGDSITDCWRWKAPRYGTNIWAKYYAPLHAADFGISGDRTENVIWRIDNGELDGLHPKVIVLMIGTNNSRTNSPEQIAEGIKVILDKIQEKCPDTKILLLGVFPRNRTNDPAQIEAPAKINAIISTYANGTTIRYLNINDKFLGPDGESPRRHHARFFAPKPAWLPDLGGCDEPDAG